MVVYKNEIYQKMLVVIQQAIKEKRLITYEDAMTLSLNYNTVISLYSQIILREMNRKDSGQQQQPQQNLPPMGISFSKWKSTLIERVHSFHESLFKILEDASTTLKISSYRLAKIYLEERFQNSVKISDFLMSPTSIVPETEICKELLLLIQQDLTDAPDISLIKEAMGKEYENLLVSLCNSYHFLYETESEMRKKGKPKTPDIWFTIPMAIICSKYEIPLFRNHRFHDGLDDFEEGDGVDHDRDERDTLIDEVDLMGSLHRLNSLASTTDEGKVETIHGNGRNSGNQEEDYRLSFGVRERNESYETFKSIPEDGNRAIEIPPSIIYPSARPPMTPPRGSNDGLGYNFDNLLQSTSNTFQSIASPTNLPYLLPSSLSLPEGVGVGVEEDEEENYAVINWIDSKAMFADIETFKEHYQQLHGYYLRYGRGMVIYWHGVLEDIYYSEYYDGNIIVRDSFPDKWVFPTGEVADGTHSPSFDADLDILP